jgi:EAL domain-containing protein (putative c-di-GMP-specific phosphodiesterase class I)
MPHDQAFGQVRKRDTFGRRKVLPRACVLDARPHIRLFLRDALEELGFLTCACAGATDLASASDAELCDLLVLGPSCAAPEAARIFQSLAADAFQGGILPVTSRDSPMLGVLQQLGEAFALRLLPPLFTPFADKQLRACVAALLPSTPPLDPPVDVAEALHSGWLELWYQPKVDTHTRCLRGVEALVRIRHPSWGVVPPAYFIPDEGDPHFRALSEFVIGRAIDDWGGIVHRHGAVEMSINLPISFLQEPRSIKHLCERLPEHPSFDGLLIEVDGAEAIGHLEQLSRIAKQLQFYRVAISVDDLGAEWPALADLRDFPFVEVKVDRKFVTGCADDALKQTVCRRIVTLADQYGARTVAEGVESRADLEAVRDMEFDLVQGFLFGRPMPAEKFSRTAARHAGSAPT